MNPLEFHKLRSPIKIHGGKYYLARELRRTFNEGAIALGKLEVYVSLFGGGFSDGLNIVDYGQTMIYNDIDPRKANLFACLRDHGPAIKAILKETSYLEENFKKSLESTTDPIEAACNTIIRSRFSRGGLGEDFCWSDRTRGGQPEAINSWQTFVNHDLDRVIHRCKNLIVFNGSYWQVCLAIADTPTPGVLAYFDPPYVHGTRSTTGEYGAFELPLCHADPEKKNSHEDMLECVLLLDSRGIKCVVSGYHNPMYTSYLKAFKVEEFKMAAHSSQAKTKSSRIEVIWRNF